MRSQAHYTSECLTTEVPFWQVQQDAEQKKIEEQEVRFRSNKWKRCSQTRFQLVLLVSGSDMF